MTHFLGFLQPILGGIASPELPMFFRAVIGRLVSFFCLFLLRNVDANGIIAGGQIGKIKNFIQRKAEEWKMASDATKPAAAAQIWCRAQFKEKSWE
jgi:hypothetical protein